MTDFRARAKGHQGPKKNPPRHAETKHKFFPTGRKKTSNCSSGLGFIPQEKWDKMTPKQRQKATENTKKGASFKPKWVNMNRTLRSLQTTMKKPKPGDPKDDSKKKVKFNYEEN